MKNFRIYITILLMCVSAVCSAQLRWMSLEEATLLQKNSPKKILLYFYTESSDVCKEMEQNTFKQPVIQQMIHKDFYAVKFDATSEKPIQFQNRTFSNASPNKANALHSFAKYFNVNSVPTLVFLDENGQPITSVIGNSTPRDLEPFLDAIGNNTFKSITTKADWDKFRSGYKYKSK